MTPSTDFEATLARCRRDPTGTKVASAAACATIGAAIAGPIGILVGAIAGVAVGFVLVSIANRSEPM